MWKIKIKIDISSYENKKYIQWRVICFLIGDVRKTDKTLQKRCIRNNRRISK